VRAGRRFFFLPLLLGFFLLDGRMQSRRRRGNLVRQDDARSRRILAEDFQHALAGVVQHHDVTGVPRLEAIGCVHPCSP
jgi:predicted PurR-regulated permease PerM